MKDKRLHVMGDPELDRIFSDAYRDTLKHVEKREREKELQDNIDALAELFKSELKERDLTPAEMHEFTDAFRNYIRKGERDLHESRREKQRLRRLGTYIFLGMLLLSGLIYLGRYKPFTSMDSVKNDLDEYISKVEQGYGEYADEYYRTLDKFEKKLGPMQTDMYESVMYGLLDERYEELLSKVESGELTYFDDARRWAGYFPEKQEVKARRERADNVFSKVVGRTVDDSVDKLLEGAKSLLEQAKEKMSGDENQ